MAKRGKASGAGEASVPPALSASERETVDASVASLSGLNLDQLRLQWRNQLGGIAPAHLPGWLLMRVLAYRIQAAAFGDLDRTILRRLRDDALELGDARPFAPRGPTTREGVGLKSGALLVREWSGRLERVMVLDDGYAWNVLPRMCPSASNSVQASDTLEAHSVVQWSSITSFVFSLTTLPTSRYRKEGADELCLLFDDRRWGAELELGVELEAALGAELEREAAVAVAGRRIVPSSSRSPIAPSPRRTSRPAIGAHVWDFEETEVPQETQRLFCPIRSSPNMPTRSPRPSAIREALDRSRHARQPQHAARSTVVSVPPNRDIGSVQWPTATAASAATKRSRRAPPVSLEIVLSEFVVAEGQDRVLTLPWTRPSSRRRREIIQGVGEAQQPLRAMRTKARDGFIKALRDAHRWLDELLVDPTETIELLAVREGKSERSIRMTLSLAFISPVLAEAAMEGRLPRGFCIKRLTDLPMLWSEQWRAIGLQAPAQVRAELG